MHITTFSFCMITVEFRRKLDPKFHKDPLRIDDSISNQKNVMFLQNIS